MELMEAIKNRVSIRAFSDKEISPEIFAEIMEAGRWAPSPLNSQPWHFIIIKNRETLQKLSETADHGVFLKLVPILVAVISKMDDSADNWLAEHDQYTYSSACAMQNMWLAAWGFGIGSCWVTLDDKASRKLLNIPDDYKLLGSLAFGYPRIPPVEHKDFDRKPLTDLISEERFGE